MLTAIIAAYVGLKGLSRWRAETVGKRKSELAEHVLADFYQARDIYEWARFPGSFPGEGAARPREEGESEDEGRRRDAYYVPVARLTERRNSSVHFRRASTASLHCSDRLPARRFET